MGFANEAQQRLQAPTSPSLPSPPQRSLTGGATGSGGGEGRDSSGDLDLTLKFRESGATIRLCSSTSAVPGVPAPFPKAGLPAGHSAEWGNLVEYLRTSCRHQVRRLPPSTPVHRCSRWFGQPRHGLGLQQPTTHLIPQVMRPERVAHACSPRHPTTAYPRLARSFVPTHPALPSVILTFPQRGPRLRARIGNELVSLSSVNA